MISDLVAEDLAAIGRPGPLRAAAGHLLAGGLVELLQVWLDATRPAPPGELVLLFDRLSRPVLAELARGG